MVYKKFKYTKVYLIFLIVLKKKFMYVIFWMLFSDININIILIIEKKIIILNGRVYIYKNSIYIRIAKAKKNLFIFNNLLLIAYNISKFFRYII